MVKAKQLAIWLKTFALGRAANTAETLQETAEELERLSGMLDELPYRHKDIMRSLILIRTSSNAHGSINFQSRSEKVERLPPAAKEELAGILYSLAFGYDAQEVMRRSDDMKKAIEEGRIPGITEWNQPI